MIALLILTKFWFTKRGTCIMAHCSRKLSVKIGVKRLYFPDEAGINKRGLFFNFVRLNVMRTYGAQKQNDVDLNI